MHKQRTFTAEDWRPFMRGPETPLDDLIESFLVAREAELSPRTIDGYRDHLTAFSRSLSSPKLRDLSPVSYTHLTLPTICSV